MRGTKRSANFDSAPVFLSNDSMQSKRVVIVSQLDAERATAAVQQPQQLDVKRAESSRQHVKALNAQFASWIQAQLQSHADELWEDGVQDYLNHAKGITEKFSDVVNWIKTNVAKGESFNRKPNNAQTKPLWDMGKNSHKLVLEKPEFSPALSANFDKSGNWLHSDDAQKKPPLEADSNNHKVFLEKPGLNPTGTVMFGTPWSPGIPLNNIKPFTVGGNQIVVSANPSPVHSNFEVSNEEDGDGDEQPSSPSVKRSKEEGIIVVHEVKCKLYVKPIDPEDKDAWKDKGTGQLLIKCQKGAGKGTKESKPTIILRDDVGKVLLNALLYPGIKTNLQKNSVVAIFHTSADGLDNDTIVARTFLLRTKNEEDRDKLAAVIQEYAPAP